MQQGDPKLPDVPAPLTSEGPRSPILINRHGVVIPPGETDENKRLAISTWERTQNIRSVTLMAGSLVTAAALIVSSC